MNMTPNLLARSVTAALLACALGLAAPTSAADDFDGASSPDATIALSNFQAATAVVGQTDFSQNLPNQGGSTAADTISDAFGSAAVSSSGTLYLSDYDNRRVLGFSSVPTANGASAAFVLGQADFTSSVQGDAANQLGGPQATVAPNNMLVVDEFYNHRVLIWKTLPTANQVPADIVVGQAGFGTHNSGCTSNSLNAPETSSVGGGKLVVADSSNNRVMIWTKLPKKNGRPAKIVLGQKNFTTCVENNDGTGVGGAPSQSNLGYPSGVWTDGTRIVVLDSDNNRVMIWTKFPKKSFTPADIVLGQPDFVSNKENNDGSGNSGSPSAKNLKYPYDGVFSNGTQLFVVDQMNNRILVWNTFPTQNFAAADVVLGQPNFTCGVQLNDGTGCVSGGASAKNLRMPTGVYQSPGNKLIVTDGGDSRYLIF